MKILFLDLDGTLLNDQKEISKGNHDALQKALSAGHRVVIATGRPIASARMLNKRLGLNKEGCYIISFNGGIIYDCGKEEAIYEKCLSKETALKVVRICNEVGIHAQAYDLEHVLVEPNHDPEIVEYYGSTTGMHFRQVASFDETLPERVPKILVISLKDRNRLEQAAEALKAALSTQTDCFYSSGYYLEVVAKGLNKGAAVRWLCEKLGVSVADSIACGDQINDLTMIKAAGLGVAMANATEEVKASADYITLRDNNHDGIAEVVEKFML